MFMSDPCQGLKAYAARCSSYFVFAIATLCHTYTTAHGQMTSILLLLLLLLTIIIVIAFLAFFLFLWVRTSRSDPCQKFMLPRLACGIEGRAFDTARSWHFHQQGNASPFIYACRTTRLFTTIRLLIITFIYVCRTTRRLTPIRLLIFPPAG